MVYRSLEKSKHHLPEGEKRRRIKGGHEMVNEIKSLGRICLTTSRIR